MLVSSAAHQDGCQLITGELVVLKGTDICESVAAKSPSELASRIWISHFKTFAFWVGWIGLLAWAEHCDRYYLFNGWWMVLVGFWLTASAVAPKRHSTGHSGTLPIVSAAIASTLLFYGTFDWLQTILDGWSWGPPGQWLRILSIPLRATVAAVLTATMLVPQLRCHLGVRHVPLLMCAALVSQIAVFGADLCSALRWRDHAESSCIELFVVAILPLIVGACAGRIGTLQWPNIQIMTATRRMWRAELPVWLGLFVVYPLTLIAANGARFAYFNLPKENRSIWEYETFKASCWLLLVFTLVGGSVITWRCINRHSGSIVRGLIQGIILLLAAPVVFVTFFGKGFEVGNVFTNSAKAALGSAYDFEVRAFELQVSGEITYGFADRLEKALKENPNVFRVRLASTGGLVDEAVRAADLIAAHKLDTIVSKECSSSCTIIFVAGTHRSLENNGRLGFHAARSADPMESVRDSRFTVLGTFGVQKQFVDRVEAVSPTTMWYPTQVELLAANVLTVVDHYVATGGGNPKLSGS